MADCLFCKIISGDIPSEKVYEDEETFAFLDIKPVNPGHTLVAPKKHSKNILDIAETDWVSVMKTARNLASKIKLAVRADGINITMNNEPAAGQDIFHSHVHLIPRMENDGYKPWPQREYREGDAKIVGDKIRKAVSENS